MFWANSIDFLKSDFPTLPDESIANIMSVAITLSQMAEIKINSF